MKITPLDISDILIIEPEVFEDNRGFFFESFNQNKFEEAVKQKSINAVIIKPNQVGTLSETLEAMHYAREHDIHSIVSHRSGETMDTFIADLAVGVSAKYMKSGAPARAERVSKYNRLLEIYYF